MRLAPPLEETQATSDSPAIRLPFVRMTIAVTDF
jgi:hypothetical protein